MVPKSLGGGLPQLTFSEGDETGAEGFHAAYNEARILLFVKKDFRAAGCRHLVNVIHAWVLSFFNRCYFGVLSHRSPSRS